MAAERAETMATSIQSSVERLGMPCAASKAAVSAKGSAKMECSDLIISSVMRIRAPRERFAGVLTYSV
jgi:hypothetical protein